MEGTFIATHEGSRILVSLSTCSFTVCEADPVTVQSLNFPSASCATTHFAIKPMDVFSVDSLSVKSAAFYWKIPIFLYSKSMLLMLIPRKASTLWRPTTQRSGNTEPTLSIYPRYPLCDNAIRSNTAAHSGGVTQSHGHMTSWMPRRLTLSWRPKIHKKHTTGTYEGARCTFRQRWWLSDCSAWSWCKTVKLVVK